ncbi:MAG: UPF0149 family protein [Gammaproteobacteria bacterium]|nr:UPF0149 family protein [Gammaproteobacteria bacterium]
MNHETLNSILGKHDFTATASEVHGLLTGLIAGGMFKESDDYLHHMADLFNNGLSLKGDLKDTLQDMVSEIFSQFESEDMSFKLVLLDEEESLTDQAQELLNWVQYFLVGFGLNKRDLKTASNELREIIEDFTNITRMDTELEDNNDTQADFYEIVEFIRISAVLCHQEFGKAANAAQQEIKTLH